MKKDKIIEIIDAEQIINDLVDKADRLVVMYEEMLEGVTLEGKIPTGNVYLCYGELNNLYQIYIHTYSSKIAWLNCSREVRLNAVIHLEALLDDILNSATDLIMKSEKVLNR